MNNKKFILSLVMLLGVGVVALGSMPLTVSADNPIPSITSVSPSSANVGSAQTTLTVNGNNFVSGATVNVNGSPRTTTFISSNQLTATMPTSDFNATGTLNITVTNPTPGGGTSNTATFNVGNNVPSISSISTTSVPAGNGAFTLTVNGSNFVPGSMVNINGSPRSTIYVSANQINAAVTAADVSNPGSLNVTVTNPTPGGGISNTLTLNVTGNNPVPTLTSISPTSAVAGGGAFTLTATGTNFNTNSRITFNGLVRPTTFVSPTQLTAVIPASDIAMTGQQAVMILNPTPGGGVSSPIIFTINPLSSGPGTNPGLPDTGFAPVLSLWGKVLSLALASILAGLAIMVGLKRKSLV